MFSPDAKLLKQCLVRKGVAWLALVLFPLSGAGQFFTNLDFERARVVLNNPTYGYLDWGLAAPGWSHSSGGDTSFVYYLSPHAGGSQYFLLIDAMSPSYDPGSQLAGRYSLAFKSGWQQGGAPGYPWVSAYLSQTGLVPGTAKSIRLLAEGPFQVFVGGQFVSMQSLGGNAYAGDISSFAGTTAELRIYNTTDNFSHTPTVVDNIVFSAVPVPEPSTIGLLALGLISSGLIGRAQKHWVKRG